MTVTGGDAAAGDDIVAYFPVGALILNVAVITNTTDGQFFSRNQFVPIRNLYRTPPIKLFYVYSNAIDSNNYRFQTDKYKIACPFYVQSKQLQRIKISSPRKCFKITQIC